MSLKKRDNIFRAFKAKTLEAMGNFEDGLITEAEMLMIMGACAYDFRDDMIENYQLDISYYQEAINDLVTLGQN